MELLATRWSSAKRRSYLIELLARRSYLIELFARRSYLMELLATRWSSAKRRSYLIELLARRSYLIELLARRSYLIELFTRRSYLIELFTRRSASIRALSSTFLLSSLSTWAVTLTSTIKRQRILVKTFIVTVSSQTKYNFMSVFVGGKNVSYDQRNCERNINSALSIP